MAKRLKKTEAVPKMGRDTFSDGTPNTHIFISLPTQIAYLSHFYRDT